LRLGTLRCRFRAYLRRAAEQPLWEVGLGVGVLGYDDYRGANSSHVYPVPVPYVLYNGTFLKTDRDGVHARLFNQTGWS